MRFDGAKNRIIRFASITGRNINMYQKMGRVCCSIQGGIRNGRNRCFLGKYAGTCEAGK